MWNSSFMGLASGCQRARPLEERVLQKMPIFLHKQIILPGNKLVSEITTQRRPKIVSIPKKSAKVLHERNPSGFYWTRASFITLWWYYARDRESLSKGTLIQSVRAQILWFFKEQTGQISKADGNKHINATTKGLSRSNFSGGLQLYTH